MTRAMRNFLAAVAAGRVSRSASGVVVEHPVSGHNNRRAETDFRAAEKAGHLAPYPEAERSVIELSDAGREALAAALAEHAAMVATAHGVGRADR